MAKRDVFDCQDMPEEIKRYFFDNYGEGKSNDIYITVYMDDTCTASSDFLENCDDQCKKCQYSEYDIVQKWLISEGATDDEIIVKRWW